MILLPQTRMIAELYPALRGSLRSHLRMTSRVTYKLMSKITARVMGTSLVSPSLDLTEFTTPPDKRRYLSQGSRHDLACGIRSKCHPPSSS
jgi:hypothetical protein